MLTGEECKLGRVRYCQQFMHQKQEVPKQVGYLDAQGHLDRTVEV